MACHANLSCVCTYITTKFATIMDFKQNGSPQSPQQQTHLGYGTAIAGRGSSSTSATARLQALKHQQSTTTTTSSVASTTIATGPPLRRRCRSESLPMAPLLATEQQQSKTSKAKLSGQHGQLLKPKSMADSAATPTPPALCIESFSLHQHGTNANNTRKLLPLAAHDLLPTIGGSVSKENVMQNGHHHHHNHHHHQLHHPAAGVGSGGVNAKDIYMSELDAYRRDRRNGGYYIASDRQLESRFARNLEAGFNPRNTIFDRANRKLRARSESEPHDIYNSAPLLPTTDRPLATHGRDRYSRDITLKRTRDTISPTLETDEPLAALSSSSVTSPMVGHKDSPPSKMLNAEIETSQGGDALGNKISSQRLKTGKTSAAVIGNGYRPTKTVRTRGSSTINRYKPKSSGGLANSSSSINSSSAVTDRKSASPQPTLKPLPSAILGTSGGTTSPTPSGMSTGTSGGESVHTQDLDAETIDQSDGGDDDLEDECNGEDDDLDDELIGDDEVLDDSMTDSEDNYHTCLAAYHKSKSHSSSPSPSVGKAPVTSIGCVVGGYVPDGPLAPSLFPNVPPYVTFATHEEKGPPMPPAIHKVLKWKLTLITPIVVRKVLLNSGFRLLKKTNDWVGIWGKHMKSTCFKTLKPYQKFNHLPGSFQIGRKDRVWRNLQTQMNRHGKKEFGFMPRTYIIPQDLKILRQMWPRYSQRNCKWIIKPPASARGTGIKVVNRWSQIPKRKPLIVQRYVERPLLINGSKFDLRLYVLVTCINPLRVYMHTDGLARFASVKYSEKSDTLSDRYMHLTNYSINKLSNNYSQNEDADACQGHKWTIKSLWSYFVEQGINVDRLWSALRNLVLRTVLAGEGPIHAMSKVNVGCKYNTYELYGIDVLLDSELVPWLLEVNISPSLHSASTLDSRVKGPLVKALLNTAMYQIPPKIPLAEQKEILKEQGLEGPLCFDKRIYTTGLSKNERLKHNQFIQKEMAREEYLNSILEELTPDDVRCLMLTEDELARSAPLERILPAPNSHRYLGFTEHPRYYNRLLDAWENRYCHNRAEGIALLQSLCERRVHLQVPPSTLKKDSNNKPQQESTNSENGSQDSGIHTDQTTSELVSQESSSVYQSQESIDQLPEDAPTFHHHHLHHPHHHHHQPTVALVEAMDLDKQPTVAVTATAPAATAPVAEGDDGIRLGDKIKLILDDALLLKQQDCGDVENAIIIHE